MAGVEKIKFKYIKYYNNNSKKNKKKENIKGFVLSFFASFLIFAVKIFSLLRKFFGLLGIRFLLRPLRIVLRLFFYGFIVKVYAWYFSLLSKLGWNKMKTSVISFLFNQKFIHIVVMILTVILVFVNFKVRIKADDLSDLSELSGSDRETLLAGIIQGEFGEINQEEELIVEGIEDVLLADGQESYVQDFGSVKTQPRVQADLPREETDVALGEAGEDDDSKKPIVPGAALKQVRTETISYTVKSGDTISTIADEFDISVNTILWENDLTAYSMIRPGDSLSILPRTGVSHKVKKGETLGAIAKDYETEESDIATANQMSLSSTLAVGQKLLIPNGRPISDDIPAPKKSTPKKYTGYTAIKEIVKAPNATPVAGNKMQWPTVGHRISQYFNWRHTGLDIANKVGTPLYAADAGTVVHSGWGNGYGNYVKIDHGGGKQTLYAHASELFVKEGDEVSKGETVAAMGSTGWSTGSHIHFEVIIDGKKYNPLNYIK